MISTAEYGKPFAGGNNWQSVLHVGIIILSGNVDAPLKNVKKNLMAQLLGMCQKAAFGC